MKSTFLKMSVAGTALLAAACTPAFDQQAGGSLNSAGLFGDAVANNSVVQSVNLRGGVLADLSARFRSAAPDMINFAFNSTALDAEARSILDRQAVWIRSNPNVKFRVYGHTDLVGSNGYNQALGLRRARAAVNYMVSRGVSRRQLEAVSSFGETRPLINTSNRERLNRRTVTEVFGFTGGASQGEFDGKVANGIYEGYTGIASNVGETGAIGGDGQ